MASASQLLTSAIIYSASTLFGVTTAASQDVDWNTAIATVQASAAEYYEYAVEAGSGWAGSMYGGHEFDRHQCAILGRMLGLQHVIADLETMPYPPMDHTSDPHELLVFSISLENWVLAAEQALQMDEAERRNVWNLDCVGHLGISIAHYVESSNPNANFEVSNGTLYVYGDIDRGFYDRFLDALDADATITDVALGSGGGSVRDAILAGYEIRRRNLSTSIHGNCFSACPLIFVGGAKRLLWAAPHRLGFHQISRSGLAVSVDDEIYRLTTLYLLQMGIDARTVVEWMQSASPYEMYEPRPGDLCAPKVATWIQRVC